MRLYNTETITLASNVHAYHALYVHVNFMQINIVSHITYFTLKCSLFATNIAIVMHICTFLDVVVFTCGKECCGDS